MDNYDLAVFVAGDSDYLPLIEEVKRLGKLVYVVFHRETDIDWPMIVAADLFEFIEFERLSLWSGLDEA